jgi:ABC-type multidrug transport system fused ATPase/permease subunit
LIQKALGEDMAMAIQFVTTFVGGFALGYWQGWELSLMLTLLAPVLAICGAVLMKLVAKSQSDGQTAYGMGGTIVAETLGSIRTVLGLGAEPQRIADYREALEVASRAEKKKGWMMGVGTGGTWGIFFLAYAASFRFGYWLIHNADYTGGRIMMVMFGVLIGAFALGQAGPPLQGVAKARGAVWHIWDTIETEPTIDPLSGKGEKPKKRPRGKVSFKKVKFAYPTRATQPILRGLNLEVPAGKTIALVGESGCGKSTTLGLLQRMYDTDSGSVSLDGKDVRKLNVTWLRQQIGVVSQEPVLFAGTIRDNIAFGAVQNVEDMTGSLKELLAQVPDKDIKRAAKKAFAHDFVMSFPEQYDTYIGEAGAQLSGGQKQRIAIARAVLKDPAILLLDEATSALDSKSEKIVQQALNSASQGRTTLIVAHRLSTIRDADEIFVFENGVIVESGSHDALLATSGSKYSVLWAAQQKGAMDQRISLDMRASMNELAEEELEGEESVDEVAAVVEEEEEEVPAVPMKRLLELSKPETWWMVLGSIGAVVNGCVMPSFALVFGEFVDLFYKEESDEVEQQVNFWTGMFCLAGLGTLIGNALQFGAFGVAGAKLTERLRDMTLISVLQNEVGWFDMKENEPNLISEKLATQTQKIQGALGPRLGMTLMNVVTVIYGLTLAFVHGWLLTIVVLLSLPIVSIGQMFEMRLNAGMAAGTTEVFQQATAQIAEAVQKMRTTAAFTREALLVRQYNWALQEASPKQTRFHLFAGVAAGVSQGAIIIIYGPIMIFGAFLVDEDMMEFKDVMIVFFAIVMMGMSMGQAMSFAPDMADVAKATDEVMTLIDRESLMDTHDHIEGGDGDFAWKGRKLQALKKSGIDGTLSVSRISFAFPTRPDVLVTKKLSVEVPRGKIVAFAGASGAGKSTIVELIQRFYDPEKGKIEVGQGKNLFDIKDLPTRWLRSQLGVVGQEPVLFSGTIADNIRLGNPNLSVKDIRKACEGAQCAAFIEKFPKKYDTEVGEKGAQLSGGQKQRIAIARAIARNPKVLLLDEATSALDSKSEKAVQKTLDRVMAGRTTIVVAHRLSTIRDADEIIVMEAGQCVERGTHDDLIKKHGAYYALVKRQNEA